MIKGKILFYDNPTPEELEGYKKRLTELNDILSRGEVIKNNKDVEDYFKLFNTLFGDRVELIQSSCHTCIRRMNQKINEMHKYWFENKDKPVETIIKNDVKKKITSK